MKQKAVIFDLDGTLIDSLENIAICMNQVLKELKLPFHEIEDYKYFVGGGISILVDNALKKDISQKTKDEVTARFKIVYDQKLHKTTLPYDGIYELLAGLEKKDYKIGILSNKPHEFTIQYINNLFSKYKIEEIHGQKEEIPKKPNPIAAINIAKKFEIPCEEIYFVGDTMVDMQTAKNAGMIAVGVLWGFRDEKELRDNGADFIVSSPKELFNLLIS